MVELVLAGGVYKRPKLNIFGYSFCPQGPRLTAPQGTSTQINGAASRGPLWRRPFVCHVYKMVARLPSEPKDPLTELTIKALSFKMYLYAFAETSVR